LTSTLRHAKVLADIEVTPEVDVSQDLIQQGLEAFVASNGNRARKLFQAGLQQDPENEQGWMGLSFVVDDPELEAECLQRVLAINPQNEHAAKRLEELSAVVPIPPLDQAQMTAAPTFPGDQVKPVAAPPLSPAAGVQTAATPPFPAPTPQPADWISNTEALHTEGEYFLVDPLDRGFVHGQTQKLPSPLGGAAGCIWGVLGFFALGALFGFLTFARNLIGLATSRGDAAQEPGNLLCSGGVLLLLCLFIGGVAAVLLYTDRRQKRLAEEGRLLAGEIVLASGRRDGDGDYNLTVKYRFRSPQTGKWIQATRRKGRDDLEHKPLPEPGTQVHVLYIDDRTHQAL
jgi:hypothetical protein